MNTPKATAVLRYVMALLRRLIQRAGLAVHLTLLLPVV